MIGFLNKKPLPLLSIDTTINNNLSPLSEQIDKRKHKLSKNMTGNQGQNWNQNQVIDISTLPKEISAGAIVYNIWNHSVLLIQGKNHFYGFPKGHIESGETEYETMARELLEETNVDLSKISHKVLGDKMEQSFYLHRKYKTEYPSKVNRVNIFFAILINEDVNTIELKKQDDEILKLGWHYLDEAETIMTSTNSNQIEYFNITKERVHNLINELIKR